MTDSNLVIDLSEEYIAVDAIEGTFVSDIKVESLWLEAPDIVSGQMKSFIQDKGISVSNSVIFTLPIKNLNYQVITLPESIPDKEKLILLGLELDKTLIGKRFIIEKLPVTQRTEGEEGTELCDYIVISPKPKVFETLSSFSKSIGIAKIDRLVPSFLLVSPELSSELVATAWVGDDRSEIVIWGSDNPLAMASISNTGDQIGDINRFVVEYFDHVTDLSLSLVRLYGPRMRDPAISFSLAYPHEIFDDPKNLILRSLRNAKDQVGIESKITKLPSPPISMTPRNIAFIASGIALSCILVFNTLLYIQGIRLDRELLILEKKYIKHKKLEIEIKKLDKDESSLKTERDFFLGITKRRTPWNFILRDLSKLTPQETWFERLNGNKINMVLSGKARSVDDVSALSINLNNSSNYFNDATIVGTRDAEDANGIAYTEFQISVKLKSPTGMFSSSI